MNFILWTLVVIYPEWIESLECDYVKIRDLWNKILASRRNLPRSSHKLWLRNWSALWNEAIVKRRRPSTIWSMTSSRRKNQPSAMKNLSCFPKECNYLELNPWQYVVDSRESNKCFYSTWGKLWFEFYRESFPFESLANIHLHSSWITVR